MFSFLPALSTGQIAEQSFGSLCFSKCVPSYLTSNVRRYALLCFMPILVAVPVRGGLLDVPDLLLSERSSICSSRVYDLAQLGNCG